jgi:hypothetical protein
MLIKDIIDENFQDYKKPSMLIATAFCDWKCLTDLNLPTDVCQNSKLSKQKNLKVSYEDIFKRYKNNPITKAIIIGGLEPFKQFDEIYWLIDYIRNVGQCNDNIVIYTGYYPKEIVPELAKLIKFKNIIMKYGRYIPDKPPIFDKVLGVELSSDNQFGRKIS